MTDPRDIQIKDYTYTLPDERIARYPLPQRDHSKLLIYDKGHITHDTFAGIASHLPQGALMVCNNTRVIQARLHFRKENTDTQGALIEVFLLEPHTPRDYEQAFQARRQATWTCMIGNLKKWHDTPLTRHIQVAGHDITLTATRGAEEQTGHLVTFTWSDADITFADILDAIGELPIPPYLNRKTEESDKQTYQTVYSKIKGSVAAPTAGLHFTPAVLDTVRQRGIDIEELTLHVGAGTFRPVKSDDIGHHPMHREYIAVRRQTIEALIAHHGQAIAVGTTSVRTLESLYYIGLRLLRNPDLDEQQLTIEQWEPYQVQSAECKVQSSPAAQSSQPEPEPAVPSVPCEAVSRPRCTPQFTNSPILDIAPVKALQAILDYLDRNHLGTLHTSTRIIIAPGYRYHIVTHLITNFHQPQSTLLLLVAALIGNDWRRVYDYALKNDFRFLSYGDSSLLIP